MKFHFTAFIVTTLVIVIDVILTRYCGGDWSGINQMPTCQTLKNTKILSLSSIFGMIAYIPCLYFLGNTIEIYFKIRNIKNKC